MRVTIVADDGKVGVDRVFREVDLSSLNPNIHAVQWDGVKGHVEYKDRRPETTLKSISAYRRFIDAWTAAEPPSPPPLSDAPVNSRELITLLITKSVITQAEIDTIKAAR